MTFPGYLLLGLFPTLCVLASSYVGLLPFETTLQVHLYNPP